jgi:hypothetical protein
MKYAAEMGSDTVTCIRSFIEIGSGIQKLIGRRFTDSMVQAYFCVRFF